MSLSKSNINGLLAVLAGMLIFKATTYISYVEDVIKQYPLVVVVAAFVLFFYREKISAKLGGG